MKNSNLREFTIYRDTLLITDAGYGEERTFPKLFTLMFHATVEQ